MPNVSDYLEGQAHGGALKRSVVAVLGQEAEQVRNLRTYNEEVRDRDPSKVAWSNTLPIELALKMSTPAELRDHYGYTPEEWDALRSNPVFIAELAASCELVKQDGMSFRLKAKLQAEELLNTGWRLIHAPTSEVPAAVKERLMATVYRMAGYDSKADGVAPGGNAGLAIQINFNGDKPEVRQLNAEP